ncbi:MAG TPA: Gldg family protein [Gemmatimonadaceae bacterium]|nr:Gldg family protein [Gemmatimonadaceae bacterium]
MSRVDVVNSLWFAGWLIALALLFWLGIGLPLQPRFRRLAAAAYTTAIIVAVVVIAALANVALALHDVHFDLTRERVFTPSRQAQHVVDALDQHVELTYFYQPQDPAGKRARDMVEVLGRRNPLLRVRTVDPDKQPSVAQTFGVRIYNAAVLEADGRRVQVMSTDEDQIALGILRVLRRRVTTICFIEGHNEYPIDNFEFHTHFEGLAGHSHDERGSGVVLMRGHGAGRMRRALEAFGYEVRKIVLATLREVPHECAAVVDLNPRTTYLPGESEALITYLAGGGSALLAYDLGFVIEPHLAAALRRLGIVVEQDVVIDPLDHYSTDPEVVAIPVYEDHPVTRQLALTFFPGIRSITVTAPPPGVTVGPLFRSSVQSYTRVVRPAAEREPTAPTATNAVSVHRARHVLAAAAEGTWPPTTAIGKPFRLVIIGDGDFASNSFLPYMANADLAVSMVRWLVHEEHAPSVASRIPVPPLVLLTKNQMQQIFFAIEVLLPLGVVLCGTVVWWRRR